MALGGAAAALRRPNSTAGEAAADARASANRPRAFIDKNRTFRYGAPGFITAEGEQFQILSVHVYKLTQKEKGGI